MKKILIISLFTVALVACGNNDDDSKDLTTGDEMSELGEPNSQANTISNQGRQMKPFNQNYEEPSTLKLSTVDGIFNLMLGGHSWSVKLANGETMSIEADSAHPSSLFNKSTAISLDVGGKHELYFDFDPLSYDVIVWAEDGSNSTYGGIASIEERGYYVLEILAHFEQGTVSYSKMVELK